MPGWSILSVVTFLPLIGALFVLVIRGEDAVALRNMRLTALSTTLVTLALAATIWSDFDYGTPAFQFEEHHAWLGGMMSYHMGLDGISILFVVLTAFLMPLAIAAS